MKKTDLNQLREKLHKLVKQAVLGQEAPQHRLFQAGVALAKRLLDRTRKTP